MSAYQVSGTQVPDPQIVSGIYDHPLAMMMADLWGGNLHYGFWLGDDDHSTFKEAVEQMTEQMIRRLDPRPGDRILDVGCGNGAPAIRLARERAVEVVGVSISAQQVARANASAHKAGLAGRVRFEHADAMRLPFETASFDCGWALESMFHMPDKGQVLSEVARVLRPGGRFPIADLVYRGPVDPALKAELDQKVSASAGHGALSSLDGYGELIERAGLEPVEIIDVSRQVHRSFQGFTDALVACRDHYVNAVGDEGFKRSLYHLAQIRKHSSLGYVLITARRP